MRLVTNEEELIKLAEDWRKSRIADLTALLPKLSWYPCCSNPNVSVDVIPGDTLFTCEHCGMHADNYGILVEGKE